MDGIYSIMIAVVGSFILRVISLAVVYIINNKTTNKFTNGELYQGYKIIEFVYTIGVALVVYNCYFGGN